MEQQLNAAADVIEAMARSAGMGVRVVGGKVLPQVVEFQVQPFSDYDYIAQRSIPAARVGQFMSLQNDLALRLSANNLRVSQQGAYIIIQMPRQNVTVFSADRLNIRKPASAAILGIGDDGKILTMDFADPISCHALIAGTTGSGKTQLAHTMIYTLCRGVRPSEIGVAVINPKGDAVSPLIGANLLAPVATNPKSALSLLVRMVDVMDKRRIGASPRIIIQADEVADLVETCPQSLSLLTRLAQRGREAAIHLLLATQRPDAKAVGALLRANMPCRIVGRVLSADESRMASGYPQLGAERLNGAGDFLMVRGGRAIRFQAAMPPETSYRYIEAPRIEAPKVERGDAKDESFSAFISDCVNETGEVSGKDLYAAYIEYCKANDIPEILDNTNFGSKVKSRWPSAYKHTRNGSVYTGISL